MRCALLAAVLTTVSVLPAVAQEQDFNKVEIKATKLSDTLYMLQGAGGNMAASIGKDGTVLIDDEFAPLADKIAAELKRLAVTDKPVRFVINTHYHFDHTGSNPAFGRQGATLLAHTNVRARLSTGGPGGNGGALKLDSKPLADEGLPVITFDHDVSVHLNGEDIRALHFPAGHTDGDSVIFFPKANVVHMGDDYVRYGFPFIDVVAGGSVQGMIAACESVLAKMPADVKVIPGHGELSNLSEMREYVTMLKDTSAVVKKALKAGRTVEQMQKDKILAAWDKKYSGDFVTTDLFIETLYNSLTRKHDAAFVKHN